MHIITAPHEGLRAKAKAVKRVDKKLVKLVDGLRGTLRNKKRPSGVGLAAPQVNKAFRLFATNLPPSGDFETQETELNVFINPRLTKHAKKLEFGPEKKHATLEGCLSIENLYGPVPRYPWAEFEWQELVDDKLVEKKGRFEWFAARVMQHELDHLDGILFTDYSLEYELPVYFENDEGKLEELKDLTKVEQF